jgi:hypothetical protein
MCLVRLTALAFMETAAHSVGTVGYARMSSKPLRRNGRGVARLCCAEESRQAARQDRQGRQEQIQKDVKDAHRTLQKPVKSASAPDKPAEGPSDNPTN